MAGKIVETPLMKQYAEMKQKHPDAVLLFRVGDFYETFSDDAIEASRILGITLTRRANGAAQYVELAGFPHHALDTYLPKLVRAGKRVAICEQLEDPKLTKKLVKRGITELVTPGVAMNDNVLQGGQNNFLAAVHFGKTDIGVAFLDISTGEFLVAQGNSDYVDKLLSNLAPKEMLVQHGFKNRAEEIFTQHYLKFELDDWIFTTQAAQERLFKQMGTISLKGFGIDGMPQAVIAAGAALHYLDITQHKQTSHIDSIARIDRDRYVRLDRFTVRNLELVAPLDPEGKSLLDVLDRTDTPMGQRTMRRWILFPLKDVKAINSRLDVVEMLTADEGLRDTISDTLRNVGDLERLVAKVATARISPREMVQVARALEVVRSVKDLCKQHKPLGEICRALDPCELLYKRLDAELCKEPASEPSKGDIIARGVSAELDELRDIAFSGKDYLQKLQQRESQATGIPSLKIGYNNVFGYYIEVTNTHRDKVPGEWIRKQTLVNAERYITPELKEYEEKIMGAQERIEALQRSMFADIVAFAAEYIAALKRDATAIGHLDALNSFARVAVDYRYVRPTIDDSLTLELVEARHPVIERQLPAGEPYISNSIKLDNDDCQIMMITGPNMSGKSALLRQTALNVIMAQTGCFVAAGSAHIGLVDKIFTRVGASDNISLGESTFMVEMNEAASILNNMSQRSLILFDELGRGTSTYDGISIAWAIVEYIHQSGKLHPKTLFATHYHELNEMAKSFKRIRNFNVSVKEIDGKVVFLRKLAPGGSEHSFGIHVAKLAGMPRVIISRADEVLRRLEAENRGNSTEAVAAATAPPAGMQLSFFQLDDPVLSQIRDEILGIDINNLTPIEALTKLNDIRSVLTGK